jgi:hypothetical protein
MKQIIVDIAKDGEIKISTKGFTGHACIEESKFLKDLLGYETSVQLVASYFATTEENTKQYLPICG